MKLRRSHRHVLLGAFAALLLMWGVMLRPEPTSSQTISGAIWQDVAEDRKSTRLNSSHNR
jgi:hypothetical protein